MRTSSLKLLRVLKSKIWPLDSKNRKLVKSRPSSTERLIRSRLLFTNYLRSTLSPTMKDLCAKIKVIHSKSSSEWLLHNLSSTQSFFKWSTKKISLCLPGSIWLSNQATQKSMSWSLTSRATKGILIRCPRTLTRWALISSTRSVNLLASCTTVLYCPICSLLFKTSNLISINSLTIRCA